MVFDFFFDCFHRAGARTAGFVCDEWVGVTLPKSVFIQNYRLGFLDIFLKLCVVTTAILLTFDPRALSVSYVPGSTIGPWVEFGDFDAAADSDFNSPMCNASQNDNYDYWYDNGTWIYVNFTCRKLREGLRGIKTNEQIFFPSQANEKRTSIKWAGPPGTHNSTTPCAVECRALGACPQGPSIFSASNYTFYAMNDDHHCLCKCESVSMYFSAGMHALMLAFSHLPRWSVELEQRMKEKGVYQHVGSLQEIHMKTILRDQDKKEIRVFEPGESISLTIEDLLLIDGGHKLDDHHREVGFRNQLRSNGSLPADYRQQLKLWPHLRLTGGRITVYISYYNYRSTFHKHPETEHPICYLDIKVIPQWQSMQVLSVFNQNNKGEEESQYFYSYGFRVSFSTSGSYEFRDFIKIFTFLASALVYFYLPEKFMAFFSKYCLGTLSDMYYKAQLQILDIFEIFSGQVCRSLVAMTAYDVVQEKNQGSHQGSPPDGMCKLSSMPWMSMRSQLHALFAEFPELDVTEVDRLHRVLVRTLSATDAGDNIAKDAWVRSAVNSDICTLKNWAALFDLDRRPYLMERIFDTNAKFRKRKGVLKALRRKDRHRDNMNMVDLRSSTDTTSVSPQIDVNVNTSIGGTPVVGALVPIDERNQWNQKANNLQVPADNIKGSAASSDRKAHQTDDLSSRLPVQEAVGTERTRSSDTGTGSSQQIAVMTTDTRSQQIGVMATDTRSHQIGVMATDTRSHQIGRMASDTASERDSTLAIDFAGKTFGKPSGSTCIDREEDATSQLTIDDSVFEKLFEERKKEKNNRK